MLIVRERKRERERERERNKREEVAPEFRKRIQHEEAAFLHGCSGIGSGAAPFRGRLKRVLRSFIEAEERASCCYPQVLSDQQDPHQLSQTCLITAPAPTSGNLNV